MFVQRDNDGKIIGVYGPKQPGIAEEELSDDHPEVVAFLNPAPKIPQVVTMRQARLALHAAGLLDAVNAAITQAGGAAAIEWEYAQELKRDHPLVVSLTPTLGLTSEQLDALFMQAATL